MFRLSPWLVDVKRYWFRDLPNFIRNLWKFRKALWGHRWGDYHGTLKFLEISLTDIANGLEKKGDGALDYRLKKVGKINRVVTILQNINDGRYCDMVDVELGGSPKISVQWVLISECPKLYEIVDTSPEEDKNFRKHYHQRVRELEESEWGELWDTIKGLSENQERDEKFDGGGLRDWCN
jgi:hypothetical protein